MTSAAAARPSLRELAERARPVALAREQVLPLHPALEPLVPGSGLLRGATVRVDGPASTSMALAVAAGPSGAGSWVAAVGVPTLGLVATAEAGISLERLVVVARPEPRTWPTVVAALVEAFDVVLVHPPRVRAAEARKLGARARERGAVMVQIGAGPVAGKSALEADLRLRVVEVDWDGLGWGHGHLRARKVTVESGGRGPASRPRRATLWLPGPEGEIALDGAVPPGETKPRHLRSVG